MNIWWVTWKKEALFIPLIAVALAPVIGGIAGGIIEKSIAGKGVKSKASQEGNGLYLNPYPQW